MVKKQQIEGWVQKRFPDAVIFLAVDHTECVQKIKNAPPHVFITEYTLAKAKPGLMVDELLEDPELKTLAIIVLDSLPEKESYLDEIVTGKVQFMEKLSELEFDRYLSKAINFTSQNESTDFRIRFLAPNETLIREGDPAQHVYILKKGLLRAVRFGGNGQSVELGEINAGEFVGEMGYFNGEARSCNVEAVTDCELIEIPLGTFERVLYLRPAWSKKLMETLSKRLKRTVERV